MSVSGESGVRRARKENWETPNWGPRESRYTVEALGAADVDFLSIKVNKTLKLADLSLAQFMIAQNPAGRVRESPSGSRTLSTVLHQVDLSLVRALLRGWAALST
jgi:hypothetical protein